MDGKYLRFVKRLLDKVFIFHGCRPSPGGRVNLVIPAYPRSRTEARTCQEWSREVLTFVIKRSSLTGRIKKGTFETDSAECVIWVHVLAALHVPRSFG